MDSFLNYLPYLLGGAAVLGVFSLICGVLQWIHNKISYATYFVIRPIPWYYDRALTALKQVLRIPAPQRLLVWGGPLRLVGMVLLAIAAAGMFTYLYLTAEETTEFLVLELLLAAPPFYPFTLIRVAIEGGSLFTIKKLIDAVLVSAFTIAFFHRQKDLPLPIQILYDLVFLLFFTALPHLLPAQLYSLPGALLQFLSDPSSLLPFSVPAVLHIPLRLLCLPGLALCAYGAIAVLALAIRELAGNLAYSLLPFAALALVIFPSLETAMNDTTDAAQVVVLVLITAAMTVGLTQWRAHTEEDPSEDYPNYKPLFARFAARLKEKRSQQKEKRV